MKNYSWQRWDALCKNERPHTEPLPFVLLGLRLRRSGPWKGFLWGIYQPTSGLQLGSTEERSHIREKGKMKWSPLLPSSLQGRNGSWHLSFRREALHTVGPTCCFRNLFLPFPSFSLGTVVSRGAGPIGLNISSCFLFTLLYLPK